VLLTGLLAMVGIAAGEEPHPEGPLTPPGEWISPPPTAEGARNISGKIVETMSTLRYTYIQVDTGDDLVWTAVPRQEAKVGQSVQIHAALPMPQFYSPTLDRRFELIYFTAAVTLTGAEADDPVKLDDGCPSRTTDPAEIDLSGIEPAEGGKTIGALFEERGELAGHEVSVRGRVVKCLSGILGKNWLHLRDGTAGPGGANDLTVTTQGVAGVGSTLVVRGTVAVDKDFGYGYKYDLLLEDATVTIE
jgi:hypothetical protein